MALNELTVKEKLILTLDSTSGANIVPLFTYTPYTKSGYRLIDEYLEINNLKATSWIYNIDAIEFPTFPLEASESEQLYTAINLEWTSERIQLDVLCKINNSATWHKITSKSLLNQTPYPYREFSLGNHPLGNNSMIGFQIKDVGYGSLKSTSTGNDIVVITADLTRRIYIEEIIDNSQKIANLASVVVSIIVNANPSRKAITFMNPTNTAVYIDTVSTVSLGSYLIKLNPGMYYEAPSPIYTGNYWARTAVGEAALEIREFI